MKTDTENEIKSLLKKAEEIRQDVYDYDYDGDVLYCLDNAIKAIKNIFWYEKVSLYFGFDDCQYVSILPNCQ